MVLLIRHHYDLLLNAMYTKFTFDFSQQREDKELLFRFRQKQALHFPA